MKLRLIATFMVMTSLVFSTALAVNPETREVDIDVNADTNNVINDADDMLEMDPGGIVFVGGWTNIVLKQVLSATQPGDENKVRLSWHNTQVLVSDTLGGAAIIPDDDPVSPDIDHKDYFPAELPKTLWVKGVDVSSAKCAEHFRLEALHYSAPYDPDTFDEVAMTVIEKLDLEGHEAFRDVENKPVGEDEEETPGVLIAANNDVSPDPREAKLVVKPIGVEGLTGEIDFGENWQKYKAEVPGLIFQTRIFTFPLPKDDDFLVGEITPTETWTDPSESITATLRIVGACNGLKDKVKLVIARVEFCRAPTEDATGNQYGYDEMDAPPSGNDDHISVKMDDFTFVLVKVYGVSDGSAFSFTAADTTIADVGDLPSPAPAAGFLLKITGKNKNKTETTIDAHAGGVSGPICGQLRVNVYQEISLNGNYFRVYKTGAESATIPPALPEADIATAANGKVKYSVAKIALAAPTKKGVAFDLNNNGRVDFYKNTDNTETKEIYDALAADAVTAADLVLLKEPFYRTWVISGSVSAGSTNIALPGVEGLLIDSGRYRISRADTSESEPFRITSISGTTIIIDTDPVAPGNQGFATAHPMTADPATTHVVVDTAYMTVGLSANTAAGRPALVVGATAAEAGRILGHEQMHGTGLSDVNKNSNLMHFSTSNPTTLPLRFKKLVQVITGTPNPKPGSPTDNQWEDPAR